MDAAFLTKLQDSFSFVPGVPVLTLSATEHRNLKRVMPAVLAVADARAIHIPTPALNNLIRNALDEHPPRTHKGKRLKILYATQARSPVRMAPAMSLPVAPLALSGEERVELERLARSGDRC